MNWRLLLWVTPALLLTGCGDPPSVRQEEISRNYALRQFMTELQIQNLESPATNSSTFEEWVQVLAASTNSFARKLREDIDEVWIDPNPRDWDATASNQTSGKVLLVAKYRIEDKTYLVEMDLACEAQPSRNPPPAEFMPVKLK